MQKNRGTFSPALPANSVSQLKTHRLDSIDLLRGLVMAIMALDHTRDFFQMQLPDPMDPTHTWAALFFIRWITHFCAPVFVLLAGVSGYLMRARKTPAELAWFLASRGFWLIFLELTWVRCFGWFFNFDYRFSVGQVIWAIGWSMIVLACLVRFPTRWVGAAGTLILLLHNLTDGLKAEQFGPLWWLWRILHDRKPMELWTGHYFFPQYPLLPWIAILLTGYGLGEVFKMPEGQGRRICRQIGFVLLGLFVGLRATNLYGNPRLFQVWPEHSQTLYSFLNCEKYPPSLLFALMTLGPALILLSYLSNDPSKIWKPLVTLGRVPMFFYLIHLPLLHGVALLYARGLGMSGGWLLGRPGDAAVPAEFGVGLAGVYAIWMIAMAFMFPLCNWFAEKKRQSQAKWLSYF